MIARRADKKDGTLDRVYGAFVVKMAGGEAITRHCLMIREPDLQPEAMIAETGIFSEKEMAGPTREKHRQAFERLKKLANAETFADPALTYGGS